MQALIWVGALVTLVGLVLIVMVIRRALRLKGQALPEEKARAALAQLVPLNFGALGLSFLGLALVVVGVILG